MTVLALRNSHSMDLDEPIQDPFDFDLGNFDLSTLEQIDLFPSQVDNTQYNVQNNTLSHENPIMYDLATGFH